jgi:hypothetical protein
MRIYSAHSAALICTVCLISGCSIPQIQNIKTALAARIDAWMHKKPEVIQTLEASQALREQEFIKAYQTDGIPDELATIAGHIDRIIQDIETIQTTLKTLPPEERSILLQEKEKRDTKMVEFLKANDPLLEQFTEKSLYKKDVKLYKFVNVLRTRAFLFERTT